VLSEGLPIFHSWSQFEILEQFGPIVV
jgi:hypothetical protein